MEALEFKKMMEDHCYSYQPQKVLDTRLGKHLLLDPHTPPQVRVACQDVEPGDHQEEDQRLVMKNIQNV